jgi:hypothetical protein
MLCRVRRAKMDVGLSPNCPGCDERRAWAGPSALPPNYIRVSPGLRFFVKVDLVGKHELTCRASFNPGPRILFVGGLTVLN